MEGKEMIDLDEEFFEASKTRNALENILRTQLEFQQKVNRMEDGDYLKAVQFRLANGETTGNPLQDELIRYYNLLDKAKLDKILNFSKMLEDRKGTECLLFAEHEQQIKFEMLSQGRNNDNYVMNAGFIFGILSGDRLRINDTRHLILPFERYFKEMSWRKEKEGRNLEPFQLVNYFGDEPSAVEFIAAITNEKSDGVPTSVFHTRYTYMQGKHATVFYVGTPLLSDKITSFGERPTFHVTNDFLNRVRKSLSAATPTEVIAAEGI